MEVGIELFSLSGKVAVVTGGGGAIGGAIALGFARAGADLVLADIRPASLAQAESEVRRVGREPLTVVADVTRESDVSQLMDRAIDQFGRIDILVNVVGGLPMRDRGLAIELGAENVDSVIDLNLKTAFLCSGAAARVMIQHNTGGSIINLGSIAGITRNPRASLYGAAKAAVIHLTKTLAHELGEHGIRANAIAPGLIDTPLSREARVYLKIDDVELARSIPLRRPGQIEDVAAVALFLASEASAYVTGQTIVVGGGLEHWG